jgi:hypothetical protein
MGGAWEKLEMHAYTVLVGKLECKKPLGRPRRRWENKIIMDLKEIGFEDLVWSHIAQDIKPVFGSLEQSNEALHGIWEVV